MAVRKSGKWAPVSSRTGPTKALDDVSVTVPFPDLPQCSFLNYTISYYLDSNRG